MRQWGRRIRGAIGIGLTWAAAWFGAGMLLLLVVGTDAADVPFPLFFGLLGFLAGATFAGLLGLVEKRRRFAQLSLPRFAAWGAVGGALLAGVVGVAAGPGVGVLGLAGVFAAAGAASAAGTLALARRAREAARLDGGAGDEAHGRLTTGDA